MYCPALGTRPLADGERQAFDDVSAVVAPLAAWEEAVHLGDRLPIAVALVLQEACELSHRCVAECPSEAVVADHAAHVQILNGEEPNADSNG
jgi:hypothetical protein